MFHTETRMAAQAGFLVAGLGTFKEQHRCQT